MMAAVMAAVTVMLAVVSVVALWMAAVMPNDGVVVLWQNRWCRIVRFSRLRCEYCRLSVRSPSLLNCVLFIGADP